MTAKSKNETFEVKGDELLKKVKEIIKEGNARTISIKDKAGRPLRHSP